MVGVDVRRNTRARGAPARRAADEHQEPLRYVRQAYRSLSQETPPTHRHIAFSYGTYHENDQIRLILTKSLFITR